MADSEEVAGACGQEPKLSWTVKAQGQERVHKGKKEKKVSRLLCQLYWNEAQHQQTYMITF